MTKFIKITHNFAVSDDHGPPILAIKVCRFRFDQFVINTEKRTDPVINVTKYIK